MNSKILVLTFVLAIAVGSFVAFAATESRTSRGDQQQACIPQPSQQLGVAALSEGVGFIMQGGIGPILMLVIAFIIGMLVSHAFWTAF